MLDEICKVDSCTQLRVSRGWCQKHYTRWRRHGSPHTCAHAPDVASRIAKYTKIVGECLIWTGSLHHTGYGQMKTDTGPQVAHKAHWRDSGREVPVGMMLDHTCRNRACVNLEHLRLVTNKQNQENRGGARRDSSSGYRGVYQTANGSWKVIVVHNHVRHQMFSFGTPEEANEAAIALRNELYTHNEADKR